MATPGIDEQLGSTGDIRVRRPAIRQGVGVTIDLALPDQLPLSGRFRRSTLVTISVTEINSTFDALRYPATCPSTPARSPRSVDSYATPPCIP